VASGLIILAILVAAVLDERRRPRISVP
jgi:hypothetical protein